jgi:hypothetical protein
MRNGAALVRGRPSSASSIRRACSNSVSTGVGPRALGRLVGLDLALGRDARERGTVAPVVIDEQVVGDLHEVGPEARVRTVPLARHDDSTPALLEQFLGHRALLEPAQEEAEQGPAVPFIKLLERAHLARSVGRHQVLVAARVRHAARLRGSIVP